MRAFYTTVQLGRFEEINISIILPSIIKTLLIYWVFFAELKKWLYYSTKQKKTLNILGLLNRIKSQDASEQKSRVILTSVEPNIFRMLWSKIKKSRCCKPPVPYSIVLYPKRESFFAVSEWNERLWFIFKQHLKQFLWLVKIFALVVLKSWWRPCGSFVKNRLLSDW